MRSCCWWLCFLSVLAPLVLAEGRAGAAVGSSQEIERPRAQRMVRVPDVRRRPVEDARATLEGARLGTGEVTPLPSEQGPGTVIAQDPPPDSEVREGSPVRLWVAVPLPTVTVPDVRGRPVEEAGALLAEIGLRRGEEINEPSDRQPGTVVRQEPEPGTQVQRGTPVRLWVAVAVPSVTVPEVRGRPLPEARAILSEAGLRPGETRGRASDEPPGRVVDQDPAPGARVVRDTPVQLWVAVQALTIRVPDLRGLPLEQARVTLARARLVPGDARGQASTQQPGTVIAQDPSPGTPAQPGTLVNLWVARSSEVPLAGIVIGAAALAGAVTTGLYYRKVKTRRLLSHLSSRLDRDPGQQRIDPQEFVSTGSEIRLRAVFDPGQQSLDCHDLIKEQDDERQ